MKIIKKISFILLTLIVFTLGGIIAPLLGVSFIKGAVISLAGCLIYTGIVFLIDLLAVIIKNSTNGKSDA